MSQVATVTLDELREAGTTIDRTAKALTDARREYGRDVSNVKSVVVEVAPGYDVQVRF